MPHRFAVAEAADRLAVHLDVGDDVDLRHPLDEAAAVLLDWGPVEVTEPAAERDQLLVAQRLTAEPHNGMLVPGLHHLHERGVVEVAEVDSPYLRAKRGTHRDHRDGRRRGVASVEHSCALGHCFLLFGLPIELACALAACAMVIAP